MSKDLPPDFKRVKKVGVTVSLNEENLRRLKEHLKKYHNGEKVSTMFDYWLEGWAENVEEYERETDERRERRRKKEKEENSEEEIEGDTKTKES